jgi:hypothetical protein
MTAHHHDELQHQPDKDRKDKAVLVHGTSPDAPQARTVRPE